MAIKPVHTAIAIAYSHQSYMCAREKVREGIGERKREECSSSIYMDYYYSNSRRILWILYGLIVAVLPTVAAG